MSSQYHLGKGLHDAEVMKINEIQLLYDYHEKNPRRNYLEIELNSSQAYLIETLKRFDCIIIRLLKVI